MFRSGVFIIICFAVAMAAGLCAPLPVAGDVRGNTGTGNCPGRGSVVVFDYDMGRGTHDCVSSNGHRRVPAPNYNEQVRFHAAIPQVKKTRIIKSPEIKNRKNSPSVSARKRKLNVSGSKARYRVRRGDTLFSISRRFGVSLALLCNANRIHNRNSIRNGQVLLIPKGTAVKVSHAGRGKINRKVKKSSSRPAFAWPVDNPVRYRRDGSRGVHSIGIVITARPGTRVTSSAVGVVRKIGQMRGYGRYVIVTHGKRYVTVYSNLASIRVSEGDRLSAGGIIGALGGGSSTLHFQIDRAGKPQNPLSLLPARS